VGNRKREDGATVGDLEDLAEAIRGGLKDALGNVIPAPTAKEDNGSGGEGGSGEGGGEGGGESKSDWGFSGRWWGASK